MGRDAAEEVARLDLAISIHAPAWGATVEAGRCKLELIFQSTRPAWGRDTLRDWSTPPCSHFNPRAPHGGATSRATRQFGQTSFQSTRPAWGRDKAGLPPRTAPGQFQSTRPAWGRDDLFSKWLSLSRHFNPRAPHGGATVFVLFVYHPLVISIHAPRMGARHTLQRYLTPQVLFQSTCPAWGATHWSWCSQYKVSISIHVPRVGRDLRYLHNVPYYWDFNPRARVGRD